MDNHVVATRKFKLRSPVRANLSSFDDTDENVANGSSALPTSRPASPLPARTTSHLFPSTVSLEVNNTAMVTPRRSLLVNSPNRRRSITSPKRNSILSISAVKDSDGNTTAIISPTSPRFGVGLFKQKSEVEGADTISQIMRSNSLFNSHNDRNSSVSASASHKTNSGANVDNSKTSTNEVSRMDYEEFKNFMLKEYGAKEDDENLEFDMEDGDVIEEDEYDCKDEYDGYDGDYDYDSYNNSSDLEQSSGLGRNGSKSTDLYAETDETVFNEANKNKVMDINKRINIMKKKLLAIDNRVDMATNALNNDTKLVAFCLTVLENS